MPSSTRNDFLKDWRLRRAFRIGVPLSRLAFGLALLATAADSIWNPDPLMIACDFILLLGCFLTWSISRRRRNEFFGYPVLIAFWLNTLPTTYSTGGLNSPFLGLNLALLFMLGILFQERVKPWGVFAFTTANYLGWIFINTTSWVPGLRPQPLWYSVFVTALLVIACMACMLAFLQTEYDLATETLKHSEELARAEAELVARTREEERYRLTAEAIPHLVWMMDLNGDAEYFNSQWTEYTGLTLEECFDSEKLSKVFHPEDFPRVQEAWEKCARERTFFEMECRLKSADGKHRWHLSRGRLQRDALGRPVRWIGTSTDIDDQKRAEDAAAAANQAKTAFLANISHEIRTPLGVILGHAELMENPGQSPEERAKSVATLRRNGQQLLLLIDDLLDISKIEAGRMQIERLPCSIPELLLDIARTFETKARDKALQFDVDIEGSIPREIISDPTRLRQILTNLVGNALKFTNKGKVSLTARLAEEGLEFVIEDTGIGIAESQHANLFQPFTQADSSTTRKFGGTGLGLALSKRLAHALDGELQLICSVPSQGTTFSLVLPTGSLANTTLINRLPTDLGGTSQDLGRETALRGLRVLLVEDSPDNQAMMSTFLETAGASVDLAADGLEAVSMVPRGNYDVVLMDIQMPRMDGYEATSLLRLQGYRRPILALTAHALKEQQMRCREAGCDDILTKPIMRTSLIQKVQRYSGLR